MRWIMMKVANIPKVMQTNMKAYVFGPSVLHTIAFTISLCHSCEVWLHIQAPH